ncbi:hypothetical protein B0H11DRAFT_2257303 [Mycena galericulata]|nr:hypothetical protein B0H11DRAFT_2257303 [Mycena galericulata]
MYLVYLTGVCVIASVREWYPRGWRTTRYAYVHTRIETCGAIGGVEVRTLIPCGLILTNGPDRNTKWHVLIPRVVLKPSRMRSAGANPRSDVACAAAPRENCEATGDWRTRPQGLVREMAAQSVFPFLIDFRALAGRVLRWLARDFGCIRTILGLRGAGFGGPGPAQPTYDSSTKSCYPGLRTGIITPDPFYTITGTEAYANTAANAAMYASAEYTNTSTG